MWKIDRVDRLITTIYRSERKTYRKKKTEYKDESVYKRV